VGFSYSELVAPCLSIRLSVRLSLSFENPELFPGDLQVCWHHLPLLLS